MRRRDAFSALALGLAAITYGACGSSAPPAGPVTGCAALAPCCNASSFPPSASAQCNGTLNAGDDTTCDELLTEYEIDGYCGSGDITVKDGGPSSLGPDCATLLACCTAATFTGDMSDCTTVIYGGSDAACTALLDSYAGSGKCGPGFDAGPD
jgi:hypothetical protein